MAQIAFVDRNLTTGSDAGSRSTAGNDIRLALARELHDSVCQTLTTMLVSMESFKHDMAGRRRAQLQVEDLQESLRDALNSLRRVLFELRGQASSGCSLSEALHELVARMQELSSAEFSLSIDETWPDNLPPHIHLNLYRIVEEAVRNAVSHSRADHISLVLSDTSDYLTISVIDDGPGFPIQQDGLGLLGMRERAIIVGADLVVSSDHGHGTRVVVLIPAGASI